MLSQHFFPGQSLPSLNHVYESQLECRSARTRLLRENSTWKMDKSRREGSRHKLCRRDLLVRESQRELAGPFGGRKHQAERGALEGKGRIGRRISGRKEQTSRLQNGVRLEPSSEATRELGQIGRHRTGKERSKTGSSYSVRGKNKQEHNSTLTNS